LEWPAKFIQFARISLLPLFAFTGRFFALLLSLFSQMSTLDDAGQDGLNVIDLHEAVAEIKSLPEELNELVTYIRHSSLPSSCTTSKQQADHIAKTIWECGRYRFK
jgi:hypothetical protein